MGTDDILQSIDRQARARNPQAGSVLPSPARGSDAPPEDYLDQGQGPVPAEGLQQQPDLAGPPVVPMRLGRDRASLGELAQQSGAPAATQQMEFMAAQDMGKPIAEAYAGPDPGGVDESKMFANLHELAGRESTPDEYDQMTQAMTANGRFANDDTDLNPQQMEDYQALKRRHLGGVSQEAWEGSDQPAYSTADWTQRMREQTQHVRDSIGG